MLAGPLQAKRHTQLSVVLNRRFTNHADLVTQPGCTDRAEMQVEENLAELLRQTSEHLDHGQFGAPISIPRKLSQTLDHWSEKEKTATGLATRREYGGRVYGYHLVQLSHSLEQMNAHLSFFILEQLEEDGKYVLPCGLWTDNRAHGEHVACKGGADIVHLVLLKLLERR